ncbi:RDD family protein [Dokdonella sp.]|uniref:RDD family protein n=1 Tax=Dokdonella sp. TaxID=2291710 RepID=UPI003529CB91
MEPIKHALVLTGEVLPGFDAANVWPALAAYFRMEPDRLKAELLARAPISIKESDDLAKLQKLQDGASAVGAATELQAMGSDDNLFVLVDGSPRGPMPHAYVEDRVRSGAWPSSISVATVGSANWRPFITPAAPSMDADQQATVAFSTLSPETVAAQPRAASTPAPEMRMSAATPAAAPAASGASMAPGELLPEGNIVNAGFWRRVAAYMLDSIILSVVSLIFFAVIGGLGWLASDSPGLVFFIMFLGYVGLIAIMWLYFAKFESGPRQATPGKQVMGIKVTDDKGQRIGFGRATGRFFGKIVSGMIMNVGYMMAGFTSRKQALHDMMAGCCVVFRDVEPGKPMPTERPKMPWYGWVLNCLPILGIVIMFASWGYVMSQFMGMASSEMNMAESEMAEMDMSDFSDLAESMDTSSGVEADEAAAVRAGMTSVFMVATETQAEVAAIADGGGDCPAEERTSNNAWIEAIQIGGIAPECTVTVRLSSSSDIPFAARIERIEWTYTGGGWRCESSMAADLLPFDCN